MESALLLFEYGLDLVDDELITIAELAILPYRKEFTRLVCIESIFKFLFYVLHNIYYITPFVIQCQYDNTIIVF